MAGSDRHLSLDLKSPLCWEAILRLGRTRLTGFQPVLAKAKACGYLLPS